MVDDVITPNPDLNNLEYDAMDDLVILTDGLVIEKEQGQGPEPGHAQGGGEQPGPRSGTQQQQQPQQPHTQAHPQEPEQQEYLEALAWAQRLCRLYRSKHIFESTEASGLGLARWQEVSDEHRARGCFACHISHLWMVKDELGLKIVCWSETLQMIGGDPRYRMVKDKTGWKGVIFDLGATVPIS